MAKRGIDEHPKTIDFADLLGIPVCYAVGPLELFWHWVAKYRPQGEITGVKATAIAHAIRFPGSAQLLLEALIGAGLVDVTPNGRMFVHDWSEHADNSVHQLLKKKSICFADGNEPFTRNRAKKVTDSQTVHEPFMNGSRLPEPEPEPEPEPVSSPLPPGGRKLASPMDRVEMILTQIGEVFGPGWTGPPMREAVTAHVEALHSLRRPDREWDERQALANIRLWQEEGFTPEQVRKAFLVAAGGKYPTIFPKKEPMRGRSAEPGTFGEPRKPQEHVDYKLVAKGESVIRIDIETGKPWSEEAWRARHSDLVGAGK